MDHVFEVGEAIDAFLLVAFERVAQNDEGDEVTQALICFLYILDDCINRWPIRNAQLATDCVGQQFFLSNNA